MENRFGSIEYNGQRFYLIDNDEINENDHCKYCDFVGMCESYVIAKDWFPCGATFHTNKVYLKKYNG